MQLMVVGSVLMYAFLWTRWEPIPASRVPVLPLAESTDDGDGKGSREKGDGDNAENKEKQPPTIAD